MPWRAAGVAAFVPVFQRDGIFPGHLSFRETGAVHGPCAATAFDARAGKFGGRPDEFFADVLRHADHRDASGAGPGIRADVYGIPRRADVSGDGA